MAADEPSFLERHEFLIRRLHSLSGLIPVGAFMCVHLVVNASVLNGPATFQNGVYAIHALDKLLPLVEWTTIFLPLLFHAIVGVWIVRSGLPNSAQYGYAANIRYTLQRATGMVAAVFIVYHVFHMHGWFHWEAWLSAIEPLGGHQFRPYNASSTAGAALQNPLILAFYGLGVVSCVYHLANGLWTMGITWGVWISPPAQKRAFVLCSLFGVGLLVVGLSGLIGMMQVGSGEAFDEARQIEDQMYEYRVKSGAAAPNEHKRAGVHQEEAALPGDETAPGEERGPDDAPVPGEEIVPGDAASPHPN